MAANRFFDNDSVEWQAVLEPHWQRTEQRMAAESVVLCLQDTTELDFNGQHAQGLGPLSYEAQRGMYLHPTYAVTTAREPLGILDVWMWARETKNEDGKHGGPKESLRRIEELEVVRMINEQGLRHTYRTSLTFAPPPAGWTRLSCWTCTHARWTDGPWRRACPLSWSAMS